MIQAYIQNAYDNIDRFSRSDIVYFQDATKPKNWLMKLHLSERTILKVGWEETRFRAFWHYAEALHLTDDFFCLFGKDDSSYKLFANAYSKLLKAHKEGLEEEKRARKEKLMHPLDIAESFIKSTITKIQSRSGADIES